MNKEKLESARNVLFIALGIDIAVISLVVIGDFWVAGVLKDIGAGRSTADKSIISTIEFWDSFAKLMFLTTLGVGLGLVRWLNACYGYAKETIGASGFKNEGWTIWGWVIPILSLFKPYQVISEIYKAGASPYTLPDGWKKASGSGALLAWWIFWLIVHIGAIGVTKLMLQDAKRVDLTLKQSIGAIEFHAWFWIVFLVVSALWLIVASQLTRRLLERKTTEEGYLLQDKDMAGLSKKQEVLLSPTRPLNEGMSNRQSAVNSAETSANRMNPLARDTATTVPLPAMNTESSTEEDHWATAMAEVDSGQRRPGVWAKAFAESEGDETKAKVAYLKARVLQLTDAVKIDQAHQALARQQEADDAQALVLEKRRIVQEAISNFTINREISNEQLTLIVRNADANQLTSIRNSVTGNTLLHICAERDMLLEVDGLLTARADPQVSNNKGIRPEFLAKSWTTQILLSGKVRSVEALIQAEKLGIAFAEDQFCTSGKKFHDLQDAVDFAISVSKTP
jgi:hypothetical protein